MPSLRKVLVVENLGSSQSCQSVGCANQILLVYKPCGKLATKTKTRDLSLGAANHAWVVLIVVTLGLGSVPWLGWERNPQLQAWQSYVSCMLNIVSWMSVVCHKTIPIQFWVGRMNVQYDPAIKPLYKTSLFIHNVQLSFPVCLQYKVKKARLADASISSKSWCTTWMLFQVLSRPVRRGWATIPTRLGHLT